MNPELILNELSEQITREAAECAGSILVCVSNDGVFACRDNRRGNPVKIIARYKADVVRAGLTPDEWRLLGQKIARAAKE